MFGKKREKNPDRVGIGRFWAWGSREVSETCNVLILGYFMFYCTDTLYLDPVILGILLAVSRVIDAITDVIAGYLVDRTKTRLGKGRPYELCVIGTWISVILMFSCPESWGDTPKYIWVLCMYLLATALFNTFLNAGETVYMVRAFKRGQIIRVQSFMGVISSIAGFAFNIIAPQLIAAYAPAGGGWTRIAIMVGCPVAIIGMMRFIFIKETEDVDADSKSSEEIRLRDALTILRKNKYIWIIVLFTLFTNFASNLGLQVYYFEVILGNVGLQSVASALTIFALPFVFFFPKLLKKMQVHSLMALGAGMSIFGEIVCFFANTNLIAFLIGNFFVMMGALPMSHIVRLMIFDCASYNEWKKMPRMEGTLAAIQGFAKRTGGAISVAFGGILLGLIGYNAQMEITSGTMMGIRFGQTLLPGIFHLITFLILFFCYKLDDMMPQINAENEAAREAAKAENESVSAEG